MKSKHPMITGPPSSTAGSPRPAWFVCCLLVMLCLTRHLSAAASDWQLTYGQTLADYQSTSQTLTNQGFRPLCLDADGTGTASSYSAVWLKDGYANWLSEIELTADQLSQRIATLTAEGYRVLCLDSHGNYPQERYAAVWIKDGKGLDFVTDASNPTMSIPNSWTTRGYLATWFDLNTSSGLRFSTVYCHRTAYWWMYWNMTEADFRDKLQAYSDTDWPLVVRSYNGKLAALWVDYNWLDSPEGRVGLNQTAVELEHAIRQYSEESFEPVSLTQSSTTGTALFCSVWRRPLAPLQPNRIAGLKRLSEGRIQVSISNEVPADLGRFCELLPVLGSTNLVDWEPLATVVKSNAAPGPAIWLDDQATHLPARFYRMPTNRFITPLPEPTGPFGVGELSQLLTDPNRYDGNRGTNLQFMVTCWYPAIRQGGLTPAPYLAEAVAWSTWYPIPGSRLAGFATHSSVRVPLATNASRYPVILCSSMWHRRENLTLVEELASHGFLVVGVDHQTTPTSVYPDGTVVRGPTPTNSVEAQLFERTTDARLVLDQMERWQTADPLLAGHLDLDRIGAFGWGFGGATAASLANADARCRAAANLVGGFSDDMVSSGCAKPFLMIFEDTPDSAESGDNRLAFYEHCHAAAYYLKLARTSNFSFYEYAILMDPAQFAPLFGSDIIDGYRAHDLTRSTLVSFFKRHLKGEEDGVLDRFFTNSIDFSLALQRNVAP